MGFIVYLLPVILILLYCLLAKFLILPHDSREPPLVPSTVPIFGHLFGMLRHGSKYYPMITRKWNYPVYTLGLPRSKVYIVNSPSLISMADRHAKTISFAPYVVQFAKRILVPTTGAVQKLADDLLEEGSEPCLRHKTLDVMHKNLAAGEGLETSTQEAIRSLDLLLNVKGHSHEQEVNLFSWVRTVVATASTDAIYGAEHNPFRDCDVQEAFWSIDDDFALLGLSFFPAVVAPKGTRSRKKFFEAFNDYYRCNGHEKGSKLIKARYEVNRNAGVSVDDISHFDLAVCYGTLVNTVPGTSWAIYHLFSDPGLLLVARSVVSAAADDLSNVDKETGIRRLNVAAVVDRCPLLTSMVRETLRVHSTNAAARVILKDTMLDNRYLLKKDAFLFIPSEDVHNNETVWGPTAKSFDPRRFLSENKAANRTPASAYRAFGTGASVCPGRFFATNEILGILVMMVLRYDVKPTVGNWGISKGIPHFTKSILTPAEDIRVTLKVREVEEEAPWDFYWDSSQVSWRMTSMS